MMKHAQAAMEFLMTYGWSIVAVLLSIAALAYFGVINPHGFLPESCILFPGLSCIDFNVDKVEAQFIIHNGLGSNINYLKLTIPGCMDQELNSGLSDGESVKLVSDCDIPWDSIRGDILVTYSTSTVSHQRIGKLNTKVNGGTGVSGVQGLLIADHFENSNVGISSSGISYGAGKLNQGIIIDASDTLRYSDSSNPSPIDINQGTIEMWTNPNWGSSDPSQHYFFDFWRAVATSNRITIFRHPAGGGTLYFQIPGCGGCQISTNIASWNALEWHHIAATWQKNPGLSDDVMELYIDRTIVASQTGMDLSGLANPIIYTDVGNYLGTGTNTFNGVIDEFKVYNYVKSY